MADRDDPASKTEAKEGAGPPSVPESIGTPGLTDVAEEGGRLVRAGKSDEAGSLHTKERLGPVGEKATAASAAPESDVGAPTTAWGTAGPAPQPAAAEPAPPIVPAAAPVLTGAESPSMILTAPPRRRVESRAKLAGHPVHPMLIVFPLGLLATSVVFDGIALKTRNPRFAIASSCTLPAGVIGGLLAGAFGLVDWLGIPAGTRAKRVGLWHGAGNVLVSALFSLSWWRRRRRWADLPDGPAFGLGLAGAALALVTGWLGGELVDRLGVGVYADADVDAPSSL